jgi:D-glycero-beta-D-manno-heptose 1-phosphate adenylyltransferase
MNSILSSSMNKQINTWRDAGDRLVFTNGVFDILHVGHVTYLAAAQKLGHRLIIGLNSDDSVRRLGKGSNRPVHQASDRKKVLEGLRSVDLVVEFTDDTPAILIAEIRPDVLVKGGDYDPDCKDSSDPTFIVGSIETRANGGSVQVIPFVKGHSTTGIIEKSRTTK